MHQRTSTRTAFSLVELLVAAGIMALLTGLLLAAVQRVREAGNRAVSLNNLHQVRVALYSYHDTHPTLPAGTTTRNDPYLFLNWPARILPWIEQAPLWLETQQAFAISPYFGIVPPHGARTAVLPLYICPSDGRQIGNPQPENVFAAFTHYLGVSGSSSWAGDDLLYADSHVRWADITEGLSQTVLVGDRPPSSDERFGWWYAGVGQQYNGAADAYLSVREVKVTFWAPMCPGGPYHYGHGSPANMCDTFHFWSQHPGGPHFLVADGSVHFSAYSADPLMPALASRAG